MKTYLIIYKNDPLLFLGVFRGHSEKNAERKAKKKWGLSESWNLLVFKTEGLVDGFNFYL